MQTTRRELLVATAGLAGLAGCAGGSGSGPNDGDATTTGGTASTTTGAGPAWLTTELTDVVTGETFTVAGLAAERPVILETFAVWCSTCLAQQREMQSFHAAEGDDAAASLSLNIDPNESASKVTDHRSEHGFDWHYAVAPPDVSVSLSNAFGQSVLNPPSAPVIVVCRADSAAASRLRDGVKGADELRTAVEDC